MPPEAPHPEVAQEVKEEPPQTAAEPPTPLAGERAKEPASSARGRSVDRRRSRSRRSRGRRESRRDRSRRRRRRDSSRGRGEASSVKSNREKKSRGEPPPEPDGPPPGRLSSGRPPELFIPTSWDRLRTNPKVQSSQVENKGIVKRAKQQRFNQRARRGGHR